MYRPNQAPPSEPDATSFGRLSTGLPLGDLRLARLIYFGLLFGCECDCIVMACALSMPQDVFTLPVSVFYKDQREFQRVSV